MLEIIDAAGNKRAIDSLKHMTARTNFGIQKALERAGKDLHATFNQEVLAKNKTGRIYRYKGRKHQASAPGETPANRSGNYRKSSGSYVNLNNELIFGASAKYAELL